MRYEMTPLNPKDKSGQAKPKEAERETGKIQDAQAAKHITKGRPPLFGR